jgi:hypothetical protein
MAKTAVLTVKSARVRPPRASPALDLRQGHVAQVAGGVQGVDVDAVAVGAGQPQHLLVDGGDVDGRRG